MMLKFLCLTLRGHCTIRTRKLKITLWVVWQDRDPRLLPASLI